MQMQRQFHPQGHPRPHPSQAEARRLTAEDKQVIGDWVASKCTSHDCPVCGQNSWAIGDYLIQNGSYVAGSSKPGRASYPAAMLMCSNCAYVRSFMAAPMGLTN